MRKKVKNEIYPEGKEILETRKVRKGSEEVALIDEMDPEEGKLIDRAFRAVKPACSVEVGFSSGISALYACDALKANGNPSRHIIMARTRHQTRSERD